MTLTCADGGIIVQKIRWSYWGPFLATRIATLCQNGCTPDCADGTNIVSPAEVLLDLPKPTASGEQFSRVVVITQEDSRHHAEIYGLNSYPAN
jgi:hypothetical protein